jgi:hypothetical protein
MPHLRQGLNAGASMRQVRRIDAFMKNRVRNEKDGSENNDGEEFDKLVTGLPCSSIW